MCSLIVFLIYGMRIARAKIFLRVRVFFRSLRKDNTLIKRRCAQAESFVFRLEVDFIRKMDKYAGSISRESVSNLFEYDEENVPFRMFNSEVLRMIIQPLTDASGITINAAVMPDKVRDAAEKIREQIPEELRHVLFSLKVDAATKFDRGLLCVNAQFVSDGILHVRTLGVNELRCILNIIIKIWARPPPRYNGAAWSSTTYFLS